jgi:hypothetical protein
MDGRYPSAGHDRHETDQPGGIRSLFPDTKNGMLKTGAGSFSTSAGNPAKDLFATGNYAFAWVKAQDAFAKGNESLNDAINFRLELTKTGGTETGGNWLNTTALIIIGMVVVIIAIAGYFLTKKKNRWEEY